MNTRQKLIHRSRYFFSPSTMRFFNSRLESVLAKGDDIYFVTSEQFIDTDGTADPRFYQVRISRLNVSEYQIDTIEPEGDKGYYSTLEDAKAAMKSIAGR